MWVAPDMGHVRVGKEHSTPTCSNHADGLLPNDTAQTEAGKRVLEAFNAAAPTMAESDALQLAKKVAELSSSSTSEEEAITDISLARRLVVGPRLLGIGLERGLDCTHEDWVTGWNRGERMKGRKDIRWNAHTS